MATSLSLYGAAAHEDWMIIIFFVKIISEVKFYYWRHPYWQIVVVCLNSLSHILQAFTKI